MKHSKYLLLILLGLFGITACSVSDQADRSARLASTDSERSVRYRKNIDQLSEQELAAYEHAVAMMKKKSQENIYDRTGFLWQAWVHNCTSVTVPESRQLSVASIGDIEGCRLSHLIPPGETHSEHPGMCEHAKDTFLQWHRAEFYFYEKSLQNADPLGLYGPSTRDVTVPYWNFTRKPSGTRYPKAYENPDSPLYTGNRKQGSIDPPEPFTSPYLLAYLIYTHDWPEFGGYPPGGNGNYGAFEAQIHNPMHDEYVGGFLTDPKTAGLDPLFYAFHAYIDYIFEKWIEEHGSAPITSSRYFMRGEQSSDLQKPVGFSEGSGSKREPGNYTKNMGRAEIYFDTRTQGYAYQPGPGGEFIPRSEFMARMEEHQKKQRYIGITDTSLYSELLSHGARKPSAAPSVIIETALDLENAKQVSDALINIKRKPVMHDYNFQADVYLFPEAESENIQNEAFRQRYLAISAFYWTLSGHHDHSEDKKGLELTQDISRVIQAIVKAADAPKKWRLAVAISGDQAAENDFYPLSVKIQ